MLHMFEILCVKIFCELGNFLLVALFRGKFCERKIRYRYVMRKYNLLSRKAEIHNHKKHETKTLVKTLGTFEPVLYKSQSLKAAGSNVGSKPWVPILNLGHGSQCWIRMWIQKSDALFICFANYVPGISPNI